MNRLITHTNDGDRSYSFWTRTAAQAFLARLKLGKLREQDSPHGGLLYFSQEGKLVAEIE